jgi:hypothetical protein
MNSTRMLCIAITGLLFARSAFSQSTIQDQFGSSFDPLRPGTRIVLVASNLRDATKRILAWTDELSTKAPTVPALGLAELRGLPFFVPHAAVIRQVEKDSPRARILLDWKGELSATFDIGKTGIAVFVLSPEGKILYRAEGGPSPESARAVAEAALAPRLE